MLLFGVPIALCLPFCMAKSFHGIIVWVVGYLESWVF
jgi:hypothetical protein